MLRTHVCHGTKPLARRAPRGSRRSEELQELLTNKSSQRWDLIDPKKRDAWLLRTLSKLESEDALEAVKAGPPTPATV